MLKNVREIVADYLRAKGLDGLYSDLDECGCGLSDLMPCDSPCGRCEPAIERYCPCCGEPVFVSFKTIVELCRNADESAAAFADAPTQETAREPMQPSVFELGA